MYKTSGRPTRFPSPSVRLCFFLQLSLSLSPLHLSVRSVRASELTFPLLSPPTGNSTHRSQHCSQGKGHSCIFHVMNEPRMHRCSSTAMPPVISFFLARSFYLFVSARLDENAKCRTKHASSGVPGRRGGGGGGGEKKNSKRATRLVFRRRIRYKFLFLSIVTFSFFPFPPSLSFSPPPIFPSAISAALYVKPDSLRWLSY